MSAHILCSLCCWMHLFFQNWKSPLHFRKRTLWLRCEWIDVLEISHFQCDFVLTLLWCFVRKNFLILKLNLSFLIASTFWVIYTDLHFEILKNNSKDISENYFLFFKYLIYLLCFLLPAVLPSFFGKKNILLFLSSIINFGVRCELGICGRDWLVINQNHFPLPLDTQLDCNSLFPGS